MPSERSVYSKIQVVLDVAKSVKLETMTQLIEAVRGLKADNFLTRHYDTDEDSYVIGISERSIQRTIDLCRKLTLIGDDGRLTEAGRQASRKTQFDNAVASQIRAYFDREHISLSDVNRFIMKNLHANPPVLSTTREIWNEKGKDTHYSTFARMLSLLAQCGGANTSQKKIYLHIDEH